MGRYHTQANLIPTHLSEAVCAQILSDDASVTTVDPDLLAPHIEDAEALVDTYVGQRYDLPLPAVPAVLRLLACRITKYSILASRPGSVEDGAQKDYDAALALLDKIASGQVSLGSTVAGALIAATSPSTSTIVGSSTAPVFSRSRLGGY